MNEIFLPTVRKPLSWTALTGLILGLIAIAAVAASGASIAA